jgi:hypothetical protein
MGLGPAVLHGTQHRERRTADSGRKRMARGNGGADLGKTWIKSGLSDDSGRECMFRCLHGDISLSKNRLIRQLR